MNAPQRSPVRRFGPILCTLGLVIGLLTACDSSPVIAQGVVTSPSGATVGGADVVVYADDAPTVVATTKTNPVGEWSVRSSMTTAGTYRLRVADTWYPAAGSWADAASVTFDEQAPPRLGAVVDPPTRLTGSLVHTDLTAVAGWLVVATNADGVPVSTTTVDGSGAFRLPLVAGAGSYRLVLHDPDTETTTDVGGAPPMAFTVAAGQDLRVGTIDAATGLPIDPGIVASAVAGPFEVTTTSVPAGNGFGGGTIYSPTSDAHAPYGTVVVTPGFLMTQDTMSWYGPRIASQGFVVFTIDTNATGDFPGSRATQMLTALDWLTGSSTQRDRIDPARTAVMGWSMGGGGSLEAGLQRPSLRAVVALAPWQTRTDYSAMQVPTLIVACQNDSIAPLAQHASPMYDSLGATLPREYIEIAGAEHFCVTTNNTVAAQRTAIARQVLGFLQRYVDDDPRYSAVICPEPTIGGVVSDSRSSCPT